MSATKVLTQHAYYLSHATRSQTEITEQARESLRGVKYDTLIGTGLSGAIIVPLLARSLRKHWMIVRKPNDGSHSYRKAEGSIGGRWVFVDDLVDSGATRDRVLKVIDELCAKTEHPSEYLGAYLYAGSMQDVGFYPVGGRYAGR